MAESLFRELPADRRHGLHGDISIAVPISWQAVGYLLFGLFVIAFGFLLFADYARVETVSGQITPREGVAEITASRAGIVTRVKAREGDRVAASTALIEVAVQANLSGGASEQEIVSRALDQEGREVERRLDALAAGRTAQIEQINGQRRSLRSELAQVEAQLSFQESRVRSAENDVEQVRALAERGIITRRDLARREDDVMSRKQEQAQLTQSRSKLTSDLDSTTQALQRIDADHERDRSGLLAQKANLDKQRAGVAAQQSYVLEAPIAGAVTAVVARVGQSVAAGRVLAMILPDNATLEAELSVPSQAAGFIKPGQLVRLAIDAFPYETFGTVEGMVSTISSAAEVATDQRGSKAVYRTEVAVPDASIEAFGERRPLTPGMKLTARIITHRRSLLEWLFEPLFAVTRR